MKQGLMTTREASAALQIGIRHLLSLIYEGKLPAHKVGMLWQIPASAVEARRKDRESRHAR